MREKDKTGEAGRDQRMSATEGSWNPESVMDQVKSQIFLKSLWNKQAQTKTTMQFEHISIQPFLHPSFQPSFHLSFHAPLHVFIHASIIYQLLYSFKRPRSSSSHCLAPVFLPILFNSILILRFNKSFLAHLVHLLLQTWNWLFI